MTGEEIAARARSQIGVRFRAQGRSAEYGLDCVGLVAMAIGADRVRADYPLRGGSARDLAAELEQAGLERVAIPATGDVLVLRAGPAQLHLAIVSGLGVVHADAGLRRVVERPGPAPWPVLQVWRMRNQG
jgi:cell wall-associated NlpC family hydrolase